MPQQLSVPNYAELIAGIRGGNSSAVTNFQNTFTPGIHFFVTRESSETNVLGRVDDVIASVIYEIKKGRVNSRNLPSKILQSVRQHIGVRKLSRRPANSEARNQSVMIAAQVATVLLNAIPEREREALKRYYVDLEADNAICAEFRDSRHRLRTQFFELAIKCRRATK